MVRIGDTELRFENEYGQFGRCKTALHEGRRRGTFVLRVVDEAARTDAGRQRHANEDSYYARAPVYAVADGMGGAQAGEVASRIAAEAFDERTGDGTPEQQLARVATEANRRIFELAQEDSSRSGMGTTLTGLLVDGDEVAIVHVGDSRAYLFRDGELRQLTRTILSSRSCAARAG